ncbi:MAG TPA: 3-oxoacyl-ACP synthase [Syntrophomonas sp.]|nr:3-oxoacyl-ACP synthase [Syntrophomonas sp.]
MPFEEVDRYLGEITDAPPAVAKWFNRIRPLMKEMLDIDYYHFAIDPDTRKFTEDNITMSVKAAEKAIEMAHLKPADIQFIAYGSAHQHQMPTASVRIQEALGIVECAEISVHANCTSAYKAFLIAFEFIQSGRYDNALVLSSSVSSSELIAEYYNQPLLKKEELFLRYFLCDGAGAVVLQKANDHKGLFVENAYIESIGGKKPAAMLNKRPAYWQNPKQEYENAEHHLAQMFNEQLRTHFHDDDGSVFYKGLKRMIEKYRIDLSSLKYFQVNFPSKHIAELIIDECALLGIKKETLYSKMSDMGYVGPPMVFICLDKILREEKLSHNDLILSFVTEVSKFMQAGFALRYYC